MNREPVWLPIDAVIDLHAEQIAEHGGTSGLRDRGLLESALARPRQIFAYGNPGPDVAELATAYGFAIARNHPFVDGNKRIGLVCIGAFVELNGMYLDATEHDALDMMVKLAASALTEADLAIWIRRNLRSDPTPVPL
jgi:death-on-curing protein